MPLSISTAPIIALSRQAAVPDTANRAQRSNFSRSAKYGTFLSLPRSFFRQRVAMSQVCHSDFVANYTNFRKSWPYFVPYIFLFRAKSACFCGQFLQVIRREFRLIRTLELLFTLPILF